ncbi:hypothetical protein Bca4012_004507 [Brassica carinata]
MLGPVRAPARYNLQNFDNLHNANLQHIILESHERWLNAQEILEILLAAEANIVPISTPPVVNAEQTGLFVYNRPAYRDHGVYQQVGGNGLIERNVIGHGVSTMTMGESTGLNDELYRKRIYRKFESLAVVHYRTINGEEV